MSIKQWFCRHEWHLLDTSVCMVVACIKCEKILPPGEASKKIKELNLKPE